MKRRTYGGGGEQIRGTGMQSKKANAKEKKQQGKDHGLNDQNGIVCVCVYSCNLISQTLEGGPIYIILFSFSLCSSQTQKNGGNSVTLATNSAYVLREAADGGGRREEERKRDRDED